MKKFLFLICLSFYALGSEDLPQEGGGTGKGGSAKKDDEKQQRSFTPIRSNNSSSDTDTLEDCDAPAFRSASRASLGSTGSVDTLEEMDSFLSASADGDDVLDVRGLERNLTGYLTRMVREVDYYANTGNNEHPQMKDFLVTIFMLYSLHSLGHCFDECEKMDMEQLSDLRIIFVNFLSSLQAQDVYLMNLPNLDPVVYTHCHNAIYTLHIIISNLLDAIDEEMEFVRKYIKFSPLGLKLARSVRKNQRNAKQRRSVSR